MLKTKIISSGKLEKNKGVHIENRKIKLNFIKQRQKSDRDFIKKK